MSYLQSDDCVGCVRLEREVARQDVEIARLRKLATEHRRVDDSCDLISNQLNALFDFLDGRGMVKVDDVVRFFLTDPADDTEWGKT